MICHITNGEGVFGKRYLTKGERCPEQDLCQLEIADKIMRFGDPEPPHLYTTDVLRTAKKEYLASKYKHMDLLIAVSIMRATNLKAEIHNYGVEPIFCIIGRTHNCKCTKSTPSRDPLLCRCNWQLRKKN